MDEDDAGPNDDDNPSPEDVDAQPRARPSRTMSSRTSGVEEKSSESHESEAEGDPILTKNVEEKTGQPETVAVDVAKPNAEPPRAERRPLDDMEERQKTQSRRVSGHEVARYSGPDVSAPRMSGMNKLIEERVIKKSTEPIPSVMTPSEKKSGSRSGKVQDCVCNRLAEEGRRLHVE